MELPIITKHSDWYINADNIRWSELVRLLDIDGNYLVSLMRFERSTGKFINIEDKAFGSPQEAIDYLQTIGVDVPGKEYDDYD